MPDGKKDLLQSQREIQQELIEMKKKQQKFESDPDNYVPEGPAPEFVQTTRSKLSNFWYYSRYAIIGILIVAIILTIAVAQCATRTKYDITIVMYFRDFVSSDMVRNIATVAERYCDDNNGDGEVHALVIDCTIKDDERLSNDNKTTALLGQFNNPEAVTYIVDRAALNDLDTSFKGNFIYQGLNLPDSDGKAFCLNETAFDDAFNSVVPGYTNKFDYYLIRRNVKDTTIENKKSVGKYAAQSDDFIMNVMQNPTKGK